MPKKDQEDKIKKAKDDAKAKVDADAYRYSIGEDNEVDSDQVNQRTNTILATEKDTITAKVKASFDSSSSKPTFSNFNKSDAKKCQFHWQDDLHSMMTESERRSDAILESFEMMSINDSVEDYWKDASGKKFARADERDRQQIQNGPPTYSGHGGEKKFR